MTTQTRYRIGEVAEATGFPVTTLRYYEDQGLLPPPARSAAGHRLYGDAHVQRLELMARAKRLGLRLEEAAVLADAWQHEQCAVTHEQLVELLETKLVTVHEQIAELTRFARQLEVVYERVAGSPASPEACGPACGCAPALADTAAADDGTGPPRVDTAVADSRGRGDRDPA